MSTFDSLNDTFDIVPSEVKPIKKEKPMLISNKSDDKEKDYQYARAQIYDIIEKMQESLNGAMEVAQQSDHGNKKLWPDDVHFWVLVKYINNTSII